MSAWLRPLIAGGCFALPLIRAATSAAVIFLTFASSCSDGTLSALAAGVSAAPVAPWHFAQLALKMAAPSGSAALAAGATVRERAAATRRSRDFDMLGTPLRWAGWELWVR